MAVNDPHTSGPRRALSASVVLVVGLCAAGAALWWFSRPLDEVAVTRRRFAELQGQIAAAREGQAGRAAARGQLLRFQAQARAAAGEQRAAFERQAANAEAKLAWGDAATVRAAVLRSPLLVFARDTRTATPRAAADPSAEAPSADPRATTRSGCRACHLGIDAEGYEDYPQPFRTHPKLSAYVGGESPHPAGRIECSACHGGREDAATVASAGHSLEESGVDARVARHRCRRATDAAGQADRGRMRELSRG